MVVDDSALVRSLLTEIINRQRDMECVGAASDPFVAREMIRNTNPDVVTLDVEMPRMDGIDFLGKLMRLRPTPVVMVSTLTERGADVTLRALELERGRLRRQAQDRRRRRPETARRGDHRQDPRRRQGAPQNAWPCRWPARRRPRERRRRGGATSGQVTVARAAPTEKIVFIGASTGGTEATKEVLICRRTARR